MKHAVDTSVIVAGFASWHESHAIARQALDDGPELIAHGAIETYSVLTRLPAPHRASPQLVASFLTARFAGLPLTLPAQAIVPIVARLATEGVAGGAVYDALVGATASHHKVTLLTLDTRAKDTYRRLGVDVRFLA